MIERGPLQIAPLRSDALAGVPGEFIRYLIGPTSPPSVPPCPALPPAVRLERERARSVLFTSAQVRESSSRRSRSVEPLDPIRKSMPAAMQPKGLSRPVRPRLRVERRRAVRPNTVKLSHESTESSAHPLHPPRRTSV